MLLSEGKMEDATSEYSLFWPKCQDIGILGLPSFLDI